MTRRTRRTMVTEIIAVSVHGLVRVPKITVERIRLMTVAEPVLRKFTNSLFIIGAPLRSFPLVPHL